MILPDKYISNRNSFLGVGAEILRNISNPTTVSNLWEKVRQIDNISNFPRFVLGLDLLFTLGILELREGKIRRVKDANKT